MKATVSGQSEYKKRLLDAAGEIIAANGLEGLTAGKLASYVGLRRTVVHYHFGTMDDLLAALVTRSSANARQEVRNRFKPATLGEDIWNLYSVILPGAEAIRARAMASSVVGEAYHTASEELIAMLSGMLLEAYRLRGIEPEIPTDVMARTILMSAQFVGSQRSLGPSSDIDAVEHFMRSLFAITKASE
jgi:AcrR family transcriptional regulator